VGIFTTTLKCFIPLVGFEFSVENDEQRVRLLTVKKLEVNNFERVTVHTGLGVFRRLSASAYHLTKSVLHDVLYCLLKYGTKRSILLNTMFQKCNYIVLYYINSVEQI
jgi:hypothetical protein